MKPHPFTPDLEVPPDPITGRRVCRCGLVERPGDPRHPEPDGEAQQESRRRAGDED